MRSLISKANKRQKVMPLSFYSLLFNIAYALANAVLGILTRAWWFVTISAYYIILSVLRFSVVRVSRNRTGKDRVSPLFIKRFSGVLFLFLALVLAGTVILSIVRDEGTKYHEIVMITIALYTFIKLTLAIVNLCKNKKENTPLLQTIRSISFADAVVSLFSLQRSMLVSFPGLTIPEIRLFNALTGAGVCIVLIILGLNLIRKENKMAKSKIVKMSQTATKAVVDGYKAVEKGVVTGYKAVESGVVAGYTKIEDAFVDRYLTREGESVEEAKKRLKQGE